jgi:hypothetical protein
LGRQRRVGTPRRHGCRPLPCELKEVGDKGVVVVLVDVADERSAHLDERSRAMMETLGYTSSEWFLPWSSILAISRLTRTEE